MPEQVVAYVCAVAGSRPRMIAGCVGYTSESGLVHYEPYLGVRLTDAGEKLASLVLRRHRRFWLDLSDDATIADSPWPWNRSIGSTTTRAFVQRSTRLVPVPGAPWIRLHLVGDIVRVWHAARGQGPRQQAPDALVAEDVSERRVSVARARAPPGPPAGRV